jgi:hypothetical protein
MKVQQLIVFLHLSISTESKKMLLQATSNNGNSEMHEPRRGSLYDQALAAPRCNKLAQLQRKFEKE